MRAVLLAVLCLLDDPGVIVRRYDVLEINHVYDEQAKHVFSQVLAWRWSDYGLHCQWWMRHEPRYHVIRERDTYSTLIHPSLGATVRVEAPCFRETWTQWDREIVDRQCFPPHLRSGFPSRLVPQP